MILDNKYVKLVVFTLMGLIPLLKLLDIFDDPIIYDYLFYSFYGILYAVILIEVVIYFYFRKKKKSL